MLERTLTLINILVGSCGGLAFALWFVAAVAILKSKHPYDPWDGTITTVMGVSAIALVAIVPALGWLYVVGVFS